MFPTVSCSCFGVVPLSKHGTPVAFPTCSYPLSSIVAGWQCSKSTGIAVVSSTSRIVRFLLAWARTLRIYIRLAIKSREINVCLRLGFQLHTSTAYVLPEFHSDSSVFTTVDTCTTLLHRVQ